MNDNNATGHFADTWLVVCPLEAELKELLKALLSRGLSYSELQLGFQKAYRFDQLNVIISSAGHGKAQFAVSTRFLLDQLPEVRGVVAVGAAGALPVDSESGDSAVRKLKKGDLVVGTEIVEHDYIERFRIGAKKPRFRCKIEALKHLPLAEVCSGFVVHQGVIASGDEDIVDLVRASEIAKSTGALCVAWEGAGGVRAARYTGIPYAEVRAITDDCTGSVFEVFTATLPLAMSNLAEFIIRVRKQA